MHYNVIDLFCGAGGLSLGAARAGFDVRCAVEIDPEATNTHKINFPKTSHLPIDVSTLTGQGLRELSGLNNGDLTGIIGGPPCQGFSMIGRKNRNDNRNKLFIDFFRIVSETSPKFYLAENVPAIMHNRNSEVLEQAFSFVADNYVMLPPLIITASDYGAPTTRKRVFFFGYLQEEMAPLTHVSFVPPIDVEPAYVRDGLRGLPTKISPEWQTEKQGWRTAKAFGDGYYASRIQGHIPRGIGDKASLERLKREGRASGSLGTRHSTAIARRYSELEPGKSDPISRSFRLELQGFCPTLRAGTGADHGSFQAVRPIHPIEPRVITPREAARLQGFPDWFQFAPTKWHSFRQIGSSVSPIVAERMLTTIKRALQ